MLQRSIAKKKKKRKEEEKAEKQRRRNTAVNPTGENDHLFAAMSSHSFQ